MNIKFTNDVEAIEAFVEKYAELKKEISKVIVGQDEVVKNILMAMFSRSHALLIGVPGLAKTLMITTIAKSISLSYNRIQFTPDLMPSDIMGTEILDENRKFKFVKGPIFANIVLADEINRTPPKTQSALLEAMQERSVSMNAVTYDLPDPFFVLATQNPIEQEGTYPLPEAQQDRFMFNIYLDYPTFNEEIDIVKSTIHGDMVEPQQVLTIEEIIFYQKLLQKIPITDNLYQYAVNLASSTRPNGTNAHPWAKDYLMWGAGPRASQFLIIGARTHAVLNGKYSPDIEDVRAVAHNILRHRIIKNYKAEAEGITIENIIDKLIESI
ncbi:MAG TPA: AAA family ATPase [Bacteroidales bacterium]|nr:AAA family ATPase [Bacteroidales bacterium]HOH22778.1 AAA family ATPase [Bacteroidales bacterium]HPB56992.1 AAA family ATPase [Bacteroidales bacterium]HPZ03288.1 AAA family ATPase [Bacteroidales bacterium]HQB74671.1 AAA family ATPase [Bacteroidales bacterium]